MNVERLVAGLDIGSAKTTAIIAEVVGDLPRNPSIRILGVGQARTTGLRRGVVSDIEETTRSIQKAMTDAEVKEAAEYFAAIPWQPWTRVVETELVPKTRIVGNMALVFSYVIKSNSDVPVGIEKTDRFTSLSLEYAF